MTSLYLHIPFCRKKCGYCAFASIAGGEYLYGRYCAALRQELVLLGKIHADRIISTIFVGGGTPTILQNGMLPGLLEFCADQFSLSPDIEISVETNPKTIDLEGLKRLRRAGVNRLSIGVQSFNDRELHLLGRIHSAEEAKKTFEQSREAGFTNISLDLMYGLPQQTSAAWEENLTKALDLQPEHLSLYQLTIEPDTPFEREEGKGIILLPDEDEIEKMDTLTQLLCKAHGLLRYEISNYCSGGKTCRHNLNYWENQEYLAAGAGAVSYVSGVRARREDDPIAYIEAIEQGRSPVVEWEKLDREAAFRETVVMGLRLLNGVCLSRLKQRFGIDLKEYYGERLAMLVDADLLELSAGRLRLGSRGLPLANSVMAELV